MGGMHGVEGGPRRKAACCCFEDLITAGGETPLARLAIIFLPLLLVLLSVKPPPPSRGLSTLISTNSIAPKNLGTDALSASAMGTRGTYTTENAFRGVGGDSFVGSGQG